MNEVAATVRRRPTAVPAVLAAAPAGVIRPADAAGVYAFPRQDLARLARQGTLHRLAAGYYAITPADRVGTGWLPTLEAAAAGIAAADAGPEHAVLMGITAARLHGVVPRATATAVVAVPRQRRALQLRDRDARVVFVRRDTARLDAERMRTDLGTALVTGVEQTVLDLVHRPDLGIDPAEAVAAARALLPRCDEAVLTGIAAQQRLRSALGRARALGD